MKAFFSRIWHALGFSYCRGDYYCDMCGKVQR